MEFHCYCHTCRMPKHKNIEYFNSKILSLYYYRLSNQTYVPMCEWLFVLYQVFTDKKQTNHNKAHWNLKLKIGNRTNSSDYNCRIPNSHSNSDNNHLMKTYFLSWHSHRQFWREDEKKKESKTTQNNWKLNLKQNCFRFICLIVVFAWVHF